MKPRRIAMKVIVFLGLILLVTSYTQATEPTTAQPKVADPTMCFENLSQQAWIDYKTNGTPIPNWLKWDQGKQSPADDLNYKKRWGFSSPKELVTAKIALEIIDPYIVSRSSCYAKRVDRTGTDASLQDQRVIKTLEYVIRALRDNGLLSSREEKKALSLLEGD
jgi:hypothetical protein